MPVLPRYPVYVISKGRFERCLTALALAKDGVPFKLVVEPQEHDQYAARFGAERIHVLPFSNLGLGSIPARNWVWEHAKASGADRHWILDDNIRSFFRRFKAKRFYCSAGVALSVLEDFTDRYENVGMSGLAYVMFVKDVAKVLPVQMNCHVYSCILLKNEMPYRWRGRYNEDTDLCLQVLSSGRWCTVLINTFLAYKMMTMTMKGGNTDQLYADDGRLRMAHALERMWPGVVRIIRQFKRPQHLVDWPKFRTRLIPKPEHVGKEAPPNEYGMTLTQLAEIRSESLHALVAASIADLVPFLPRATPSGGGMGSSLQAVFPPVAPSARSPGPATAP